MFYWVFEIQRAKLVLKLLRLEIMLLIDFLPPPPKKKSGEGGPWKISMLSFYKKLLPTWALLSYYVLSQKSVMTELTLCGGVTYKTLTFSLFTISKECYSGAYLVVLPSTVIATCSASQRCTTKRQLLLWIHNCLSNVKDIQISSQSR